MSDEETQPAPEASVEGTAERPARPERAPGERPARAERAAPAAEAPPPPPGTVYDVFQDVLPGVPFKAQMGALDVLLGVRPAELSKVLGAAKNDPRLAFDYLRCLTAVDHEAEGIEAVYHLYSFTHAHNVTIKCMLPADALAVPTATHLWKAADWLERECWEMFGVEFIGHPQLEPLLLEDDTVDLHPLRKSHKLAAIEIKQGAGIAAGGEGDADGE